MTNPLSRLWHDLFGPPASLCGVRLVPKLVPAEQWINSNHPRVGGANFGKALIFEARDLYSDDLLAQLPTEYAGQWLLEQGLVWRPGSSGIYDFAQPPSMARRMLGLGGSAKVRLGSWLDSLSKTQTWSLGRRLFSTRSKHCEERKLK